MMQIADSSNVRAVGYDLAKATMRVIFHTDGAYEYPEITPVQFADMVSAESVGRWIHQNLVKPKRQCVRQRDEMPQEALAESAAARYRTALELIASNPQDSIAYLQQVARDALGIK